MQVSSSFIRLRQDRDWLSEAKVLEDFCDAAVQEDSEGLDWGALSDVFAVYVPLIVAKCTKVMETKGLNIVGIYRIPRNTAAMNLLSERINQYGMDEQI
jgi:hypothetical protein